MVGYSEAGGRAGKARAAAAGGAAGAVTRALCQPLDVVKIRFQLQTEPIRASYGSKYCSLAQATALIVREEGLAALWSGHVPAQLLSVSYGIVQFCAFETLTELCYDASPDIFKSYKHSMNFACGAVAASLATIASFPFDTVRTRLIAEEKRKRVYTGVVNTFYQMSKTEGTKSLFKGLFPTLAQIAPHAGIQFVTYKLFTDNLFPRLSFFQRSTNLTNTIELTLIANLIAGSIAGLVSKLAIYPFDLAKKRLQIQGFQQHRVSFGRQFYCKGFVNCVRVIVKEEGFLGLYKGLSPSLVKAVSATALHFAVYDEIKNALIRKRP